MVAAASICMFLLERRSCTEVARNVILNMLATYSCSDIMYKYIASLHASVAMLFVANLTLSNSMASTDTVTMPVSAHTATSISVDCTPSSPLLIKPERELLLLN